MDIIKLETSTFLLYYVESDSFILSGMHPADHQWVPGTHCVKDLATSLWLLIYISRCKCLCMKRASAVVVSVHQNLTSKKLTLCLYNGHLLIIATFQPLSIDTTDIFKYFFLLSV